MVEKYTGKTPHRITSRMLLYGVKYRIVRFGPYLARCVSPRIVVRLKRELCTKILLMRSMRERAFMHSDTRAL